MAQGSETFKWILFPGAERVCWECGRELKRDDVAEHRNVYPGPRTEFHCTTCSKAAIEKRVKETRARLGLREDPHDNDT